MAQNAKLKSWVSAMRLRTLPLTIAAIGLAGFLANADNAFAPSIFLLSLSTAILLQILSNLANDYGDSLHGADNVDREGPSREVQSGNISLTQMKRAIVICAALSLVSGILLLYMASLSLNVLLLFLVLGVASIIAAVLYTNGKLPYGYMGLGDVSVFIFFGLIGVVGAYYLQVNSLHWSIFLPASAFGLLAVAVLNINNIRDIKSDTIAGKRSIPVRIGREKAVLYHYFLLFMPVVMCIVYVMMNYQHYSQLLFVLATPLLVKNAITVGKNREAKQLDAALKQMAISTLVFILIFGLFI